MSRPFEKLSGQIEQVELMLGGSAESLGETAAAKLQPTRPTPETRTRTKPARHL